MLGAFRELAAALLAAVTGLCIFNSGLTLLVGLFLRRTLEKVLL